MKDSAIYMRSTLCCLFFMVSLVSSDGINGQNEVWSTTIPGVSGFGSPGLTDLNEDGFYDVVVGLGVENKAADAGVVALDGKTGEVLWQVAAHNQIYTRPLFVDLNTDGVDEIIIAGRAAQLSAINGKTGDLIWRFDTTTVGGPDKWLNFYVPQWAGDQNGDGVGDILICNGGDASAPPTQKDRPAGWLLLISGASGEIIAQGIAPDKKEIYSTPLLVQDQNPENPDIIFGTGGETVGGSLYAVALNDFKKTGTEKARILLENKKKGFIAPPSAMDLTGDGIREIVVPQLYEELVVLEGTTYDPLWKYETMASENYVSPAFGDFNGDDIPDVAAMFALGSWPVYFGNALVLLDGANGKLISRFSLPSFQISSPLVADVDGDGLDEVLLLRNEETPKLHTGYSIFTAKGTTSTYTEPVPGMSFFSTPTIAADPESSSHSLVFSIIEDREYIQQTSKGAIIRCHQLPVPSNRLSWPAFLGPDGNGQSISPSFRDLKK